MSFHSAKHHLLLPDTPLNEWRACDQIVERIRLVTEQGYAAMWVSFAQRLRGCCPCDAISDDDVSLVTLSQTDPGCDGATAPGVTQQARLTPRFPIPPFLRCTDSIMPS